MIARLKSWGIGLLAAVAMALYALTKKSQADAATARANLAQRNATAAEAQSATLERAQRAAGEATAAGREELDDEMSIIRRGGRRDYFSTDRER